MFCFCHFNPELFSNSSFFFLLIICVAAVVVKLCQVVPMLYHCQRPSTPEKLIKTN
ncbi:hypothetical protein HanXRQr2_Chr17g0784381 [Helianthus annuus]|uniref:Uncharacterized protein n=1 Tax=Helianthus annuus TaxID=4232 RepID=A0A9K3GT36_HELAN|nr:hypothetical protein HanXRQr2_Chr17g0784381 [Helianthus annuus]